MLLGANSSESLFVAAMRQSIGPEPNPASMTTRSSVGASLVIGSASSNMPATGLSSRGATVVKVCGEPSSVFVNSPLAIDSPLSTARNLRVCSSARTRTSSQRAAPIMPAWAHSIFSAVTRPAGNRTLQLAVNPAPGFGASIRAPSPRTSTSALPASTFTNSDAVHFTSVVASRRDQSSAPEFASAVAVASCCFAVMRSASSDASFAICSLVGRRRNGGALMRIGAP